MFSYYGSKNKIAKLYPKPIYNTIIEPFSGAAWYSLLYNEKNVVLNEKYDVVYNIWRWLINQATEEEILQNIDFYKGQNIALLDLKKEHRDYIGFLINRGSTHPKNIVQKWSCQVESNPEWASTVAYNLKRCAVYLSKIKHWKIINKDYRELENVEATWFIDPPYEHGGEHYIENKINYSELAEWCKMRKGQVIVCENSKANWLNFEPLKLIQGTRHKTTEVFWTNL